MEEKKKVIKDEAGIIKWMDEEGQWSEQRGEESLVQWKKREEENKQEK